MEEQVARFLEYYAAHIAVASQPFDAEQFLAACQDALSHGSWDNTRKTVEVVLSAGPGCGGEWRTTQPEVVSLTPERCEGNVSVTTLQTRAQPVPEAVVTWHAPGGAAIRACHVAVAKVHRLAIRTTTKSMTTRELQWLQVAHRWLRVRRRRSRDPSAVFQSPPPFSWCWVQRWWSTLELHSRTRTWRRQRFGRQRSRRAP